MSPCAVCAAWTMIALLPRGSQGWSASSLQPGHAACLCAMQMQYAMHYTMCSVQYTIQYTPTRNLFN